MVSAILATGCVSHVYDLADKPPYQAQIQARYELTVDSYVVTLKDQDELYLVNRYSHFGLPLPVDAKFIGESTRDLNIKGIIRQGTMLEVAAIKAFDSFDAGRSVDYYLEERTPASGARLRVDAYYLEQRKGWDYFLNEKSFIRLGSPSPLRGEGRGEGGKVDGAKL